MEVADNYMKTAIKLAKKLPEFIKNPNDPPMSAADLWRHPSIREVIIRGTKHESIYSFLHALKRKNLLRLIPQLAYKELPGGKLLWTFHYTPKGAPEESQRHIRVSEILGQGLIIDKDSSFFSIKEIDQLEKYFERFKELLDGKILDNSPARKEFIEFHNGFIKNDTSYIARNYYEKLWLKYLVYRMYF